MINCDHWKFRDWSMLLPIKSSQLNELSTLCSRTPPSTNTTWGLKKFWNKIDSSPVSYRNPWSFSDTFHFIFPSFRCVFFSDNVIEIKQPFGNRNSWLTNLMPKPFWKHSDLTDIISNKIGCPSKEIFLHDFELFFKECSISDSHFICISLNWGDVKFSTIVVFINLNMYQ